MRRPWSTGGFPRGRRLEVRGRGPWRRPARHLLDLDVETEGARITLDHLCPGSGAHRLLGVELTEAELARLATGESVFLPVGCDRCLWERRLVVRRRRAAAAEPGSAAR
ncbi:MAG TPA: hypothetical protein VFB42_01045 [Gaiellaceae bacterium]|nr:hypothetical protein [Gaiellaceae bacterium]